MCVIIFLNLKDEDGKSGGAVYSLINDSVTRPISARSVSFKETIRESDESSSSKVSAPISKSNPISNYQGKTISGF